MAGRWPGSRDNGWMARRASSLIHSALSLISLAAVMAGVGFLSRAAVGVLPALGASWRRTPAARSESNHFNGETFANVEPSSVLAASSIPGILWSVLTRGSVGRPVADIPLATTALNGECSDLAVTWLGHASALIELGGVRVLADPVWSERVSPSRSVGPKRLHPAPIPFAMLPAIDAVIISHDHYDHLDHASVQLLRDHHQCLFVVPLGVGDHLRRWNIPEDRIVELDWNGETRIGEITLVCTQARHFSGRGLGRNDTLWSSWALIGPRYRVFFGGDTGYSPEFAEIGTRLGPFDVTLLPIGAYDEHWADIHMNPEEAVRAHRDLRGSVLLPIHWATFNLAFHLWSEPMERLHAAAEATATVLATPRPGQRISSWSTQHPESSWWRLGT